VEEVVSLVHQFLVCSGEPFFFFDSLPSYLLKRPLVESRVLDLPPFSLSVRKCLIPTIYSNRPLCFGQKPGLDLKIFCEPFPGALTLDDYSLHFPVDFSVELDGDFPDLREDEFSSLKPDWL